MRNVKVMKENVVNKDNNEMIELAPNINVYD